jgi:protein subunit release factor A
MLDSTPLFERARAALRLSDEALEGACAIEFLMGSGPGGQHRNKTQSGVRLTHLDTGAVVSATERRSQAQNRSVALERLRAKLAALAHRPKPRRPTKPTAGSKRRRLDAKRHAAQKKSWRRDKSSD